jgi:hypothetical protein
MDESLLTTESFSESIDGNMIWGQVIVLDKSCWIWLSQGTEEPTSMSMGGLVVSMPTKFDSTPVSIPNFTPLFSLLLL